MGTPRSDSFAPFTYGVWRIIFDAVRMDCAPYADGGVSIPFEAWIAYYDYRVMMRTGIALGYVRSYRDVH